MVFGVFFVEMSYSIFLTDFKLTSIKNILDQFTVKEMERRNGIRNNNSTS